MFDVLGILNTRERAIAMWLLVFSVWALSRADIRESAVDVIRALIAPKLLLIFGSAAIYTAGVVFAAHLLGLWHTTSLKETVYWFAGGAVILVGNATHAVGDPAFFRKVLRRALKLAIVIEFFVNFYALPFVVEILLVPFVALLVGMSAVAENDAKLDPARKVINGALMTAGLLLLVFATANAVGSFGELFSVESAEDLLVAPGLTLALLPFLYVVGLLSAYEQMFMRIHFFLSDDGQLRRRTKRAIVASCGLSLGRVGRFSEQFMAKPHVIQSGNDLRELVDQFARSPRANLKVMSPGETDEDAPVQRAA